jgi:hypothetical protein
MKKINFDNMHYFYRRTSGHCLGTFKTGDIISCAPPLSNIVSFTTSTLSFSSLSLSHVSKFGTTLAKRERE